MTSMVMMIVEEYLKVRKTLRSRNNLNIVKRKNTVYRYKVNGKEADLVCLQRVSHSESSQDNRNLHAILPYRGSEPARCSRAELKAYRWWQEELEKDIYNWVSPRSMGCFQYYHRTLNKEPIGTPTIWDPGFFGRRPFLSESTYKEETSWVAWGNPSERQYVLQTRWWRKRPWQFRNRT